MSYLDWFKKIRMGRREKKLAKKESRYQKFQQKERNFAQLCSSIYNNPKFADKLNKYRSSTPIEEQSLENVTKPDLRIKYTKHDKIKDKPKIENIENNWKWTSNDIFRRFKALDTRRQETDSFVSQFTSAPTRKGYFSNELKNEPQYTTNKTR